LTVLLFHCLSIQPKVKVKVKFTLEETTKAQRGSRVIALLFNLGARWEWVVNATPPSSSTPGKDPVSIV
jgi:hypothetical protein